MEMLRDRYTFSTSLEKEIAREIKEQMCLVSDKGGIKGKLIFVSNISILHSQKYCTDRILNAK